MLRGSLEMSFVGFLRENKSDDPKKTKKKTLRGLNCVIDQRTRWPVNGPYLEVDNASPSSSLFLYGDFFF